MMKLIATLMVSGTIFKLGRWYDESGYDLIPLLLAAGLTTFFIFVLLMDD